MDKFGELFDKIDEYMEDGCPNFRGISNHMLAKWHLEKLGILPDHIGFAGLNEWFGDTVIHSSPTVRHSFGKRV